MITAFFDWLFDRPLLAVVVVFTLIFSVLLLPLHFSYTSDRHGLYKAWCRAHNSESLTYEEWNDLRRAGLLPYGN